MGKVISGFTLSLDGFIADANDDIGRLFKWYFSGDTVFSVPSAGRDFKVSAASADILRERFASIGAVVTGRRDFEVSKAWGGTSPLDVPIFIVTHNPPAEWADNAWFTFVTDGVESAIAQAKKVAGDKDVAVGSSTTTQQALKAGLLDEIHIDLAPILLGSGIRLFDHLDAVIELEETSVIEGIDVTHLKYRVIKTR